jgi:hypothetical protein
MQCRAIGSRKKVGYGRGESDTMYGVIKYD